MTRLTGNDARGLMEAYESVYSPKPENQIQEHFEAWVNALVEEGYDLSSYTWDDMYEVYEQNLNEFAPALAFGIPAAAAAALGGAALLNPDIRRRLQQAGTGLVQRATDLVTGGNRAEKDYQNWLNQPLQSRTNQRRSQSQRDRAARELERRRRESQGRPLQGNSSSQPNPANTASRPNPQQPSSSSSSSTSRTARGTRIDTGSQSKPEPPPEQSAKDLGGLLSLKDIGRGMKQELGYNMAEPLASQLKSSLFQGAGRGLAAGGRFVAKLPGRIWNTPGNIYKNLPGQTPLQKAGSATAIGTLGGVGTALLSGGSPGTAVRNIGSGTEKAGQAIQKTPDQIDKLQRAASAAQRELNRGSTSDTPNTQSLQIPPGYKLDRSTGKIVKIKESLIQKYLLDQRYASTEKEAATIVESMSENWKRAILGDMT